MQTCQQSSVRPSFFSIYRSGAVAPSALGSMLPSFLGDSHLIVIRVIIRPGGNTPSSLKLSEDTKERDV